MQEPKEPYPAEGIEFFRGVLENIRISELERDSLWWYTIDHIGSTLQESVRQGKVTPEEEKEVTEEVRNFMGEGTNYRDYKEKMGEEAHFWWVEKEEGTTPRG